MSKDTEMKIVAGLSCIDDYVRLVKAGADELFCGYVPYKWTKKYGVMLSLNRREVISYNIQVSAYEDMKILSRMVEHYHIPVTITFNSLYYIEEQYPLITEFIEECMKAGFSDYIIADPALILYLRNRGINCRIHLSGETAEVNRNMIELFNNMDIARYIFHRKNTIEDMRSCIDDNKVKGLEYEAFLLNEMCHYTGGYCNSLHCDELAHMCRVPYKLVGIEDPMEDTTEEPSDSTDDYLTGQTGCGLCALKKLKAAGITHLKLVGRGNYTDYMVKDIEQLKRAIKIEKETDSQKEYEERIVKELFSNGCSHVCYYRDI